MTCTIPTHRWTANLERILGLYSVRLSPTFDKKANPRHSRHQRGKIWKIALAQSVFADLSLGLHGGKRFFRLEHSGLSGVIVYELPASIEGHGAFTLKTVFGDDSDSEDLSMDVEDLLDAVCASLIYAPAYACTSFVVSVVLERNE
jgi:hypothetical protein